MTDNSTVTPKSSIPPDDPQRHVTIARPDEDDSLPHFGIVGDTYTILLSGDDTAGKYTLIDMLVPPGGGPHPHRHDFEEMFTVLVGEVEITFHNENFVAKTGETVNVPANAPHGSRNVSGDAARLLCTCTPPGQEEFFSLVGVPVMSRTQPPRTLDKDAQAVFIAKATELAKDYRTELLLP